ncbi:MAG: hypothetical protein ACTHMT_09595 [Verrucomicrobiota bacterium]
MATSKEIKLEQKVASQQKEIILELQALVKDIERCELSTQTLKAELESVNLRHANRQTTQDDIHYLEDLLKCARKKLVWEKQMASLQKRTPDLMSRVEAVVNHPQSNPDESTRNTLLESLKNVQTSMHRLQSVKIG